MIPNTVSFLKFKVTYKSRVRLGEESIMLSYCLKYTKSITIIQNGTRFEKEHIQVEVHHLPYVEKCEQGIVFIFILVLAM